MRIFFITIIVSCTIVIISLLFIIVRDNHKCKCHKGRAGYGYAEAGGKGVIVDKQNSNPVCLYYTWLP